MKIHAILSVVAFCAIHVAYGFGMLDTLRNGITRQKTTVQSTVNRLERHKRNFDYDLSRKLSNVKMNSMQEINSITNPKLKSIEDATKQSTAGGKDASSCYQTARARLREYSITGFSDLDSCQNEALSSASPTQENMQSTVLAGQQVVSHLDSIFISCFTTSIQQMESCIVGMLPDATQMARSFESTAEDVMNNSGSVVNTAQITAINCNRGIVSAVRDGATAIQQDSNRCIAAL